MADRHFEIPRLAEIYDRLDPDRSDLDLYAALVDELGARRVLDMGCGTGTLACLLARQGIEVTGVDPAAAALDVAARKPGAERVRWLQADASKLPPLDVDLVTMTGNVAQVFLTNDQWVGALQTLRAALRPDGWFVFESRDPRAQAWLEWNRQDSYSATPIPGVGIVEAWVELVDVNEDLVSFRSTFVFNSDGVALTSDSTLRFRSRAELSDSLSMANLVLRELRDAPDRPGRELVFVAQLAD